MENPNQNKIDVLIVGSTGHLGHHMVRECLKRPNLRVHLLSHNPETQKELCDEVTKAGGKVTKGDITKPNEIKDVTKGIHTVISCVSGRDEKTLVEGQTALLNDSIQNGVKRFVPSEFGFDLKNINMGQLKVLDDKLLIRKQMEKGQIKGLFISNGLFMEKLFDLFGKGFEIWCDPNQKVSLISMEDCAKIVAAAVSDPNRTGELKITGETLTLQQICDVISKTSGSKIAPKQAGSLEELKKRVTEAKTKGDINANIELALKELICDGRAVISQPQNQEFANIKPKSFEEFIKHHPEHKIQTA